MGCLKSKGIKLFSQDIAKLEFADKSAQIKHLNEILNKIEKEITLLKIREKKHFKNKNDDLLLIKKRACYLSQMTIFVKWTIKVIEVNKEDRRIDQIIEKADLLVKDEDEFLLNSLENKIKHLIYFKK